MKPIIPNISLNDLEDPFQSPFMRDLHGKFVEAGLSMGPAIPKAKKIILTTEEIVIKLLKGDFEEKCGLSFDEFMETYKNLLEKHPEKLI